MFSKILIANRGEIAVRIMRTAHEMGIATVAVYSEPDRDALHVRMAGEAYLLGPATPSQSYLDGEKLIEIARRSGAQAIHPGYGFLAENAEFARHVVEAGLTWIGPHAGAMHAMGDKLRARQTMQKAKVPLVPGSTLSAVDDLMELRQAAKNYGYPLALKASGGGGGKGLKIARGEDELESAFRSAKREAEAYFKDGTIYAERYLDNPRHVELQILADKFGNVVVVGERDCSLQRRHQKLWEEAPARLSVAMRRKMRAAAVRAAHTINYDSAGTIECLVYGSRFFFLEMNARIQVEHTVTEAITGLDLVREQIRIAVGEPLGFVQDDLHFEGFAIEGRVNAEDPSNNFAPAPGTISAYREPGGLGVRIDSAAYSGLTILPDYDSMIAKLIVWAPTRTQAISRMRRAIDEFVIEGVPTTLPILRALCDHEPVIEGTYGTTTLETFALSLRLQNEASDLVILSASAASSRRTKGDEMRVIDVEVNDKLYRVRLVGGALRQAQGDTGGGRVARRVGTKQRRAAASGNDVVSPMHGLIVELALREGEAVSEGQVVAVIEAMKMMNEIRAHRSGTIAKLHAGVGATVEAGTPLATIG